MRLKLMGVLAAIVLLMCANGFAQTSSLKESSDVGIGRYQLFQGTYTSIDLKRQQTATHAGVFLIDTKTGEVKRYPNKIDDQGNYIETWMPTETQK